MARKGTACGWHKRTRRPVEVSIGWGSERLESGAEFVHVSATREGGQTLEIALEFEAARELARYIRHIETLADEESGEFREEVKPTR